MYNIYVYIYIYIYTYIHTLYAASPPSLDRGDGLVLQTKTLLESNPPKSRILAITKIGVQVESNN